MAARMCQYEKRKEPQREHQKGCYTLPHGAEECPPVYTLLYIPWGRSALMYINPTRTVGLEEKWVCWLERYFGASLVAQTLKNPPTMQETWVWSLGWKDPLKKGMATHSSILAWRIPRREDILLWHCLFIPSNKLPWSETVIKQPHNFIWLPCGFSLVVSGLRHTQDLHCSTGNLSSWHVHYSMQRTGLS